MMTFTLASIRSFPQGLLGPGSNWKLGVGGVILSLDIPLDRECCCMNYKEGSDQVRAWKAVAAPSYTAKCFAIQYLLLPWRQNVLCLMVFAPVLSALLKRGGLNRARRKMAVGAPEKSTRAENTSWDRQYMGFPVVPGGLWEHGLHSLNPLSSF